MIRKKFKIIIIVTAFFAICGVAFLLIFLKKEDGMDGYDEAIDILKREFNADVMYYGPNPEFREKLSARQIDYLNHENIMQKSDAGYRALVLWDRNDNLELSDEELKLIKKEVEENGLDMYYIGTAYLDDFCRLGFTVGISDDEKSFMYIGSVHKGKEVQQNPTGNLYAQHGLWMEYDEWSLQDVPDDIQSSIALFMKLFATGELN